MFWLGLLGMYRNLGGYIPDGSIPEPCDRVEDMGGPRWVYDLWYGAIAAIEGGNSFYIVPWSPALDIPAYSRATVSTWHLLQQYQHIPDIRPFAFFTVLPALDSSDLIRRVPSDQNSEARAQYAELQALKGATFYAPYAGKDNPPQGIRRADTRELVDIRHKTIWECIRNHFIHEEYKSFPENGSGRLERRHLLASPFHQYIGKESNDIQTEIAEETDFVLGEDRTQVYQLGPDSMDTLRNILQCYSTEALAKASGVPARTIRNIKNEAQPNAKTLHKLLMALPHLEQMRCEQCGAEIQPKSGRRSRAPRYCSDKCRKAAERRRKTYPTG